eukprot:NODE_195_length_13287_cov_0.482484.p10 type:complete len:121 gc:universal NODE_195_length_13287_cov_0.482484:11373-11011(-)
MSEKNVKTLKTYKGDKIPFKIGKIEKITVPYQREIRVDIKNAVKVNIIAILGVYATEKKKFLTLNRYQKPVEKLEYSLGNHQIHMEQFDTKRPQSIPAVFQLLGNMNLTISAQCYTSSLE